MSDAIDLDALSDEALLDLGAQLETDLANARVEEAKLLEALQGKRLLKPGTKLVIGGGATVAGLVLSPLTLGYSLFATAAGALIMVWDAVDFGRDAADYSRIRLRTLELKRTVKYIVGELERVEATLTTRLDPPKL